MRRGTLARAAAREIGRGASDLVATVALALTSLSRPGKRALLLVADVVVVPLSFWAALALVLNGLPDDGLPTSLGLLTALLTGAGGMLSVVMGLTRIKLNAFESHAIRRTALLASVLSVWGHLAAPWVGATTLPGSTFVTFCLVLTTLLILTRLALRRLLVWLYRHGQFRDRVLIYGAGQTGLQLAEALRSDPKVEAIAFVDDNPTLQNMLIAGLPVYAPTRLPGVMRRKGVGRVILAMPSLSQPKQAQLARNLATFGCEVQTIPSFAQLLGQGMAPRPRKLSADTFLNRSGLDDEIPGVTETYAGRRVLVTGGGGSIGAELCRQILLCRPKALVIFELSEVALYAIEAELSEMARTIGARGPGETPLPSDVPEIVPVLGSIADPGAVAAALKRNRVEIVLHAAAYKHVPLLERNEIAGLANNAIGTQVVAEASRAAQVARFILVSTDKAVRPAGILGGSKRLAELIVQDMATRAGNTRFSMVRFGNVLGSSGSVVPLFEQQIARGGPVTLTDEGVTRYFMTISEAVRLVLVAGSFTRGGDVFVLDMGDPVPIRRLARQMIEGAGHTVRDAANPDGDIEIVVTGLRPGEKLHEELLIGSTMLSTPHPKILRAQEGSLSEIEVRAATTALRAAIAASDAVAARAVLARWVEGYGAASAAGGRAPVPIAAATPAAPPS